MKQAKEKFQKVSSFILSMLSSINYSLNNKLWLSDSCHPDHKKVLEKQNVLDTFFKKICLKSKEALETVGQILGFCYSYKLCEYVKRPINM